MSLPGRIFLRARQLIGRVPSAWRGQRLLWWEGGAHQRLTLGSRNQFNVPIRSHGQGTLIIGSDNMLGYRPAPCLGNGEILLQPRAKEARIVIGNHNGFSNNISLIAMGGIELGDHCMIGDQVTIIDCDFHEINPQTRNCSFGPVLPVTVGNNVWLGSRVMCHGAQRCGHWRQFRYRCCQRCHKSHSGRLRRGGQSSKGNSLSFVRH